VELCGDSKCKGLRFAGLIVYGRKGGVDFSARTQQVLEQYAKDWKTELPPLLLVVIHFEGIGKNERLQRRQFQDMELYEIAGGMKRLLRRQPAFPWDVPGSRWAKESASG
jgi:hypothetical protein